MSSLSTSLAVPVASVGPQVVCENDCDEPSRMLLSSASSSEEYKEYVPRNSVPRSTPPSSVILASLAASFAVGVLATTLISGSSSTSTLTRSNESSQGYLSMLDSADNQKHNSSRRSFVCITGQLERLELDNKINSVLFPLRAAGFEPDVALVLDDSSLRVTNDVGPKGVDFDYAPVYTVFDDAVRDLQDLDFHVVTDSPYIQAADPIVNEEYVQHLQQKAGMTYEQHRERSKNNIRMMESWQQCYAEMMADIERSASYDIVVRVREDAGFLEALDIDFLRKELAKSPRTVISNGCRTSHGMNDKAAVVSRDAARSYFLSPLQYYYTRPIHDNVVSSESFIYSTYQEEGLLLLKPPEIRSVVKLVTDRDGNTKLFPGEKKTLIHMCRVRIDNDEAPSNCTTVWDAENRDLHGVSPIHVCWPYTMKDPECATCK